MQLPLYIKNTLNCLIKFVYPTDYEKYQSFFVNVSYSENKSNYTKLNYLKKTISVNTFSRNKNAILLSYVVGLVQYIDIIERKETHIDAAFLNKLYKFLYVLLKFEIISPEEIYFLEKKYLSKLMENKGSPKKWIVKKEEYPIKEVIVYVFDGFFIHNILKTHNYIYDEYQCAWIKRIDSKDDYDEECQFIEQYKFQAEFVVVNKPFFIRPYYKLSMLTFSKEHSELLKSLSYRYIKEKNTWEKFIIAEDLKDELFSIQSVPHQNIKIISPNK